MSDEQIAMFSEAAAPITGKPSSFSISKTINGNAQRVFDHWLIPVFLEKWMFGTHTGHDKIVSLENTVRRGGDFCYQVSKGQKSTLIQGSYQELDIPSRISFTWLEAAEKQDSGSLDEQAETCTCTANFEETDGKTRLKLQFKVPAALADAKDAIKSQWTERCNALSTAFK